MEKLLASKRSVLYTGTTGVGKVTSILMFLTVLIQLENSSDSMIQIIMYFTISDQ